MTAKEKKRTELLQGIKRSLSRRPEGSLSCSFSLPLGVVVISCVTSAHRCGNKGRASRPITSVMRASCRRTCVSKISTSDPGYLPGEPVLRSAAGLDSSVSMVECLHCRWSSGGTSGEEKNKLKLSQFCWWSSPEKSNLLCGRVFILCLQACVHWYDGQSIFEILW